MSQAYYAINERFDIRPALPTDAEFLCGLMNEYGVRAALHLRATELSYWRRSLDFWRQDPGEEGFLLFLYGEPAAWLLLGGLSAGDTQIKMLAVKPEYWRQNAGSNAIGWAEEYLRNLEYKKLRVSTSADNAPALSLYEKAGFTRDFCEYSAVIPLWRQSVTLRKTI